MKRYAGRYLCTITADMLNWKGTTDRALVLRISQAIGGIQKQDIGKQVYDNDGTIQVENNEQRDARLRPKQRA